LATVVIYNVANSPLKIVKLQEETFKLKRFLRLRDWRFPFILYDILPDAPRRQLPSEEKLLGSIAMRSHEHCIIDHMMESYSNAFHTKRHRRCSKKLKMVHVELTNLALN